jgi:hypothetical protein
MYANVSDIYIYVLFSVKNNNPCPSWIMDNPAVGGGRRRGATKHSAEDQALDQIAKEVTFFNYSVFCCRLPVMLYC